MVDRDLYVPARGDLVWFDFSPHAGREQAGRRAGAVLSPESYNRKIGLVLICPITSQAKGYPFEVPIPKGISIQGVILSDHVKSLDWRARRIKPICRLPQEYMDEVAAKLQPLIG